MDALQRLQTYGVDTIRNATSNSPPPSFLPDQRASEQPQSAFLSRLPVEIRLKIYGEMLAGKERFGGFVHVVRGPLGQLRGLNMEMGYEDMGYEEVDFLSYYILMGGWRDWQAEPRPVCSPFLGLVKTCRSLYLECIDLLYAETTFLVVGLEDTQALLRWAQPGRLAMIRNLRVAWYDFPAMPLHDAVPPVTGSKYMEREWESICSTLTCMSALTNLGILLYNNGGRSSPLVEPLRNLNIEKFYLLASCDMNGPPELPELPVWVPGVIGIMRHHRLAGTPLPRTPWLTYPSSSQFRHYWASFKHLFKLFCLAW